MYMIRKITLIFEQISPKFVNSQLISTFLILNSSLPSLNRNLLWPTNIATNTNIQRMQTKSVLRVAAVHLVRSGSL